MKKYKNQLWRIPLVVSVLVALIYGLIYLYQGYVPVIDEVVLFKNQKDVFWNLPMVVDLPFVISRLWDIPLSFLFVFAIIRLIILCKKYEDVNKDLWAGLIVGLGFGLGFGLVAGLMVRLGAGLGPGLGFGLGFGLVAGFMVGLMVEFGFGLMVGLVFELGFGLMFGLGFALVAGLMIGLGVGLGPGLGFALGFALVFGLMVGLGVGLGAIIKIIFSKKSGKASLNAYREIKKN